MAESSGRTLCTPGRRVHTGTSGAPESTVGSPWDGTAAGGDTEGEFEVSLNTAAFI